MEIDTDVIVGNGSILYDEVRSGNGLRLYFFFRSNMRKYTSSGLFDLVRADQVCPVGSATSEDSSSCVLAGKDGSCSSIVLTPRCTIDARLGTAKQYDSILNYENTRVPFLLDITDFSDLNGTVIKRNGTWRPPWHHLLGDEGSCEPCTKPCVISNLLPDASFHNTMLPYMPYIIRIHFCRNVRMVAHRLWPIGGKLPTADGYY